MDPCEEMVSWCVIKFQSMYTNHAIEQIVEQVTTIVLSTPIPTIVETSLIPSPHFNVEIANEGFQTGDLFGGV